MKAKINVFLNRLISTQNKIKSFINKIIEKRLEEEKETFYRKYGKEPNEKDIRILKKDIALRMGMISFIIFLVIVSIVKMG